MDFPNMRSESCDVGAPAKACDNLSLYPDKEKTPAISLSLGKFVARSNRKQAKCFLLVLRDTEPIKIQ